jgi:hypothetical protein
MHPNYKNNYKKFLRQIYLIFTGIIIVIPFIINAVATPAPNLNGRFNKSFTDLQPADTVPVKPDDSTKLPEVALPASPGDSITGIDTTLIGTDSTGVDSFFVPKLSKDSIEAPITYKAKDSIVLVVPDKRFFFLWYCQHQISENHAECRTYELRPGYRYHGGYYGYRYQR